jgi:chemotaxis protein CheZ
MECLRASNNIPGTGTMENNLTHDEAGDSADLQALFDSIATGALPPPAPPTPAPENDGPAAGGDSDELQDLFDSVQEQAAGVPPAPTSAADPQEAVFNSLGQLARQLHDSLHGLGMDELLQDSASKIPDARERLDYIARMTEQAASRVLNATDIARPLQDALMARSQALSQRWERMFANQLSVDEFKALAADSRSYFAEAPGQLKLTNDQLLEIIMAQDFQDLTGQVIKKVVELVQGLEGQLVSLLLETIPEKRKAAAADGLLNGPVVSSAGRLDIVSNQAQVDDLLESLGF